MNSTPFRLAALACALCSGSLLAATAAKPNILFLFADDQRADTIGAHGNPHIATPNIDRLAREGVSFRRNYVFGGNSGAVCVPSRAMLHSGKHWFAINTQTLAGEKLMGELFGEQGYTTFGTGKWHNGQPSWLRAFQQGESVMFGGMSNHEKVPLHDRSPDGKMVGPRTGEKFSTELFADAAIKFLNGHDTAGGAKPFFCYIAFTAPHDPRQPPPGFPADYANRPPLPKNFLPQLPFDNGAMNGGRDENLGAWPRTESMIRDQLAEYYSMVRHLDAQIGRILATLKTRGFADNTIVVYAADNGLALGSHGLLGKQSVFEHSMRTPFIIGGPGIPRGREHTAFTYLFDIFPTLCDLTGIAPPAGVFGESVRPLWEGKKEKLRDTVFLPYIQVQRAVRDERWKLICYPKLGYSQLFDLETDPNETRSVYDDPANAAHITRLRAALVAWQARVGDKLALNDSSQPPPKVDLTGKKRAPDQWQPQWIIEKYFKN
ncbi:MAG: sulfatase-like hydrolase/transferase [Verrucomicrobia bacterium]|nr:sulfatase-like hydrolase/transferase [Verrucomicrobiota bacterium]